MRVLRERRREGRFHSPAKSSPRIARRDRGVFPALMLTDRVEGCVVGVTGCPSKQVRSRN